MRSGRRLLIVTLSQATSRDRPLHTAVSALRAAVDSPIGGCGDFTIAEVMLNDASETTRPHPADLGTDQEDRSQQVLLESCEPRRPVPGLEASWCRPAVARDQDVRLQARRGEPPATLVTAEVDRRHFRAGLTADRDGGRFDLLGIATIDDNGDPLAGQRHRAGPAEAAARGAHDGPSSFESETIRSPPF